MVHKARRAQPTEVVVTYKRSNYSDTDALLAEALKEVFEALEARYRAQTNSNTKYEKS